MRHGAQAELRDADAAIVTSYCPDAMGACEIVLSADNVFHIFYDLDTPVTLDALESGKSVEYIPQRGLGDFDLVLSYTGGKAIEMLRDKLGARAVEPLYGCADPAVHKPVDPVPEYRCILSYLGTYAKDRQEKLEQLFIGPARRMGLERFVIGGSMYPQEFPWLNNTWYVAHVPPERHPAFYCSSRFTLNVTRGAMAKMGYCPSGRLFEAAACGVPIISDYWEGLEKFFAPGVEIVRAESADDVITALRMDDNERRKIAEAARERTIEENSANKRTIELENIFSNYISRV
jgi:spore maturation protein CgeB